MTLAGYTDLIKHLPFEDQAFATQKATWAPFRNRIQFSKFYNTCFSNDDAITLSRGEILRMAQSDCDKAVLSVILWGYPRGYTRANNAAKSFPLFLKQAEPLTNWLQEHKDVRIEELEAMLKSCKGVGLSTLSKLLYFFNAKLDGNPCLIMDARIVDVLSRGLFSELNELSTVREHNKVKHYSNYLKVCSELSKNNKYKPDQLELFLFMFGNNLKQSL
ncbi:MAG: hypothetical protein ACOYVG_08995 [Bacteroidota bacterium]